MHFDEKISEMFNNAKMGAEMFSDYRIVQNSDEVAFYEPQSQAEIAAVREICKQRNKTFICIFIFAGLITLAFLVTSILDKTRLLESILFAAFYLMLLFLFLLTRKKQPLIAEGRVAFIKPKGTTHRHKYDGYAITVAFENPEQLVIRHIPVCLKVYEACKVGAPVLVVKQGKYLEATIIR